MNFFQSLKSFFVSSDRFESAKNSPVRAPITYREPADAAAELSHSTRLKLVSVMRNLYANNGFVRDIVAANDVYSVGDGITPQGSTADEAWNAAAEDLFNNWSKCVDVRGMLTLADALSLASQRLDVDGEFFVIKRLDRHGLPRLEFLETQRCDSDFCRPELGIVQGVRFGKHGKPESYFFKAEKTRREISAEHVIHCFIPETFSSVHGLPQLQHAANSIRDTKEILSLVIARAKLQNSIALKASGERAVSQGTGSLVDAAMSRRISGLSTEATEAEAAAAAARRADALKAVFPAKIAALLPEETLESFIPDAPGTDMLNALAILDRRSCGGVLPPDFFDPSKIGGASTRLVVSKAARHFGRRQTHLINTFLRPVWKFVIANAITRGRLPATEGWTECEWNCPRSITVDAGREAAQDRADVAGGFCSLEEYFAARGRNLRKEMERIRSGKKFLDELNATGGKQ